MCGNYTSILLYLASVAHLPNRCVSYTGSIDNWQYGAHYITEFYLRDKQQWVVVDAVNNIYLPRDKNGHYINVADIKKMVQTRGTAGKLATTFINGQPQDVAYDSVNANHYYYNKSNANLLYSKPNAHIHSGIIQAVIDFYSFDTQLSYYSDTNSNDWGKIILKELMLLFLFVLLVLYAYFELKIKFLK